MQLPHFNEAVIKNYRKLLREHNIPDAKIETFCKLSPYQREKLNLLAPKEMGEVEALIRVLPLVEVSCKAFTLRENDAEINCSDAVTWQFMVKYPNMKETEFPGLMHSQQYPFLKKQNWTVIVCDKMKQKVVFLTKIIFKSSKQEE